MTNFERVCRMNEAFGNAKGDPKAIDWKRVRAQCTNILDEFIELNKALVQTIQFCLSWPARVKRSNRINSIISPTLKTCETLCAISMFTLMGGTT